MGDPQPRWRTIAKLLQNRMNEPNLFYARVDHNREMHSRHGLLRVSRFIEQCVSELKPYVLIVFPQAMRLLSTQYIISDNKIEISEYVLPIYTYDEIEENYAEIKRLANQPYRGIILPRILDPDNLPEGAEVYD